MPLDLRPIAAPYYPADLQAYRFDPTAWITCLEDAKAVAAHNAWYVSHNEPTRTTLIRVMTRGTGGPARADRPASRPRAAPR